MGLNIYALNSGEGPAVRFLNGLVLVKATGEQTGQAFSLLEQLAPAGSGSPYHVHRRDDEMFWVLEGELEFFSEEGRSLRGPGSYVFLPRNLPHGFRVAGEKPARFLVLTTPAGFDGFVREAGEPTSELVLPEPSQPDIPRLTAIAARYGIEILGPLPE